MFRTTLIFLWVILSTLFLGIIAIIISFFSHTGNIVHLIARIWGRGILFVSRIRVSVQGLDLIDPKRSYIYMSNHQSNFDIPVLLAHLTVQFRWLAKAELFKIPIFSRAMRGAGYIRIDRSNRESAIESLKEAAAKMKDGVSIMIFPEGTRSLDGNIRPFKKGGFIMAVDTGVPIVPIILRGTWPIMAKSSWRINTGEVFIEIEKPIDTTGYTRETKDALIENVRSVICAGFEKGERG
ncbi:MAG: lysophospholipid acyltransferase family protein [Desulfobacterales bacterium]|jgi:1-acyl-sn-glycerol-3-phosphate acyltransferase